VERVGNIGGDGEQFIEIERAFGDEVLEGVALEKFHGDEGASGIAFAGLKRDFANVVNGADVGVIERGGGLRFAAEAGEGLRVAGDGVGEEFQGDEALEARVLGLIDDAHSATAELFCDEVMRDGLSQQRVGHRHDSAMLVWRAEWSQRRRCCSDARMAEGG
jgi:hypothetical protein